MKYSGSILNASGTVCAKGNLETQTTSINELSLEEGGSSLHGLGRVLRLRGSNANEPRHAECRERDGSKDKVVVEQLALISEHPSERLRSSILLRWIYAFGQQV